MQLDYVLPLPPAHILYTQMAKHSIHYGIY